MGSLKDSLLITATSLSLLSPLAPMLRAGHTKNYTQHGEEPTISDTNPFIQTMARSREQSCPDIGTRSAVMCRWFWFAENLLYLLGLWVIRIEAIRPPSV